MTKSIEELAKEYVSNFNEIDIDDVGEFGTDIHMFLAGAKSRDAQWLEVVNELISEIKLIDALNRKSFHSDVCLKSMACHCSKKPKPILTKADQMLKEMGIK